MRMSVERLEVVLRHVMRDLPAENLRLHVGGTEVEAGPHTGADDLPESPRETVEVARLPREADARHAEPDLVRAEELLQHSEV
jgi:hypothetical protein